MEGLPTAAAEMVPEDGFKTEPKGTPWHPGGLASRKSSPLLPPTPPAGALGLRKTSQGTHRRKPLRHERQGISFPPNKQPEVAAKGSRSHQTKPQIKITRCWALGVGSVFKISSRKLPLGQPCPAWSPASGASRGIHICAITRWSGGAWAGWEAGDKRGLVQYEGDCGMEKRGPFWIWVPQGKGKEPGAPACSAEPLPHKQGCRVGYGQIHQHSRQSPCLSSLLATTHADSQLGSQLWVSPGLVSSLLMPAQLEQQKGQGASQCLPGSADRVQMRADKDRWRSRCELGHPQQSRPSTVYRELSPGSPSSGDSPTQSVKGPHAKGFVGKRRWAYPNTGRAAQGGHTQTTPGGQLLIRPLWHTARRQLECLEGVSCLLQKVRSY